MRFFLGRLEPPPLEHYEGPIKYIYLSLLKFFFFKKASMLMLNVFPPPQKKYHSISQRRAASCAQMQLFMHAGSFIQRTEIMNPIHPTSQGSLSYSFR